jgi:putative holliday junction resolvase
MRTLAIDLGTKRIGLAMSDEGARFATPLDVLFVNGADQALGPIAEIVRKEGVERVVLGLPINMDDSIGPQARSVVKWGDQLTALTGIGIVYIDERLSSFDAEQKLNDAKRQGAKMTRKDKKNALDALAAALILQAYLDGQLSAINVDGD